MNFLTGVKLSSPIIRLGRYYSSLYRPVVTGKQFTESFRVYLEKDGKIISPFHDIPLYVDPSEKSIVNMVVEIPRWTNAKVEVVNNEKFNPLMQDIKKGKPRFVRNCFPHKGYIWNYGALPQTWEDPTCLHSETGARGDNDPIDAIEIGEGVAKRGEVKQVKVLGIMAMLDQGETDWKVVVIDTKDPMAAKLNDIDDVKKHYPGLLDATKHWFEVYKIPDGKERNEFAFNGECKDKAYANCIIAETHEAWQKLIHAKIPHKTETYNISV
ncbi:Putative Inorganic pyrophosphatase [Rhizopus microsporus]|nr:Putative Inorganic pyrophosphatase [Rhizopus microsporus]